MRLLRHLPFPIAILVFFLIAAVAAAQEPGQSDGPVLTLEPIPPAVVGDRPVVVAHLATSDGQPVDGAVLSLSVDGFSEDRAATIANGTAILRISTYLPAGTHEVRVTAEATADELPASTNAELVIQPGSIDVQVVPALEGVKVRLTQLDSIGGDPQPGTTGTTLLSDAEGFTHFSISQVGIYRVELLLPWVSPDPGVKAEFSRWQDNVFDTWRDLEYAPGQLLQAGFEVHYLVNYTFTNLQGDPVDPDDVSSITLMNSMGERLELGSHESLWVQGGRVTRRSEGLEETQLQYSVDQVIVDGANVVNKAQHRFIPAESRSWTIPLLYYSMSFASQDALFGVPIGASVEVVSPNGTIRTLPLDENGQAFAPLLPRGEYKVRVLDGGYSPPVPVALSRDQAVDLKVITVYDVVFVGGLGGGVALALLVFGRWKSGIMRGWGRIRHPRALRPS